MSETGTITSEIGPWGMVPIWILDVTDEDGKRLSGADLRVYIALRSFADRGGGAFPLVRTIAKRAGVDMRTAEKSISRLRRLGLLTSTQKRSQDGKTIVRCDYRLRDIRPPQTDPPGEMAGTPRPNDRNPLRRDGRSKNTPSEHTKGTHQDLTETATRSARSGAKTEGQPKPVTAEVIAEERAQDRELFRALIGDRIYSYGHEKRKWREGEFSADAIYDALRRMDNPKVMPGAYVAALHDVDDWLLTQKLARVG